MQRFSTWLIDILDSAGYDREVFCSHSGIALFRLQEIERGSELPDVNGMSLIVETLSRHTKRPPSWFYLGWHEYGWLQVRSEKQAKIVGYLAKGDPERVRDLRQLTWAPSKFTGNYDSKLAGRETPTPCEISEEG